MGFDHGRVSFRLFYLSKSFGPPVVARFAAHAAPPIATLGHEPIQGWVAGEHLLETRLDEDNCIFGSCLHATLMRAERRIPEALLRAHCRIEEQVRLRASGTAVLPRQVRSEIRDEIVARLLPTMPPTLTGLPVVVDFRNDRLYAAALSDPQVERLGGFFRETTGVMPLVLNAETAALRRKRINPRDVAPCVFSPDPDVPPEETVDLGLDFLTWLWWWWEAEGGTFRGPAGGPPFGLILEGPVTFFREGQGAHEAVLRKGTPLDSREAGIALLVGKRLRRARLTLAQADAQWSVTVDADFGFRGVKLPKAGPSDPGGVLQERMLRIETFVEAYLSLYDRFLDARADAGAWKRTLAAMRTWIARRARV